MAACGPPSTGDICVEEPVGLQPPWRELTLEFPAALTQSLAVGTIQGYVVGRRFFSGRTVKGFRERLGTLFCLPVGAEPGAESMIRGAPWDLS